MTTQPRPACDCGEDHKYAMVIDGERVAMCVWAKALVADWPPLTGEQRARYRALFNVGGTEPDDVAS